MGKWSEFKKKLPTAPVDQTYQDKVNVAKAKHQAASQSEQIKRLANLRKTKDDIEAGLSHLKLEIEALSQLLVDGFQALDTTKVSAHGVTVFLKDDVYCRVADQGELRSWLKRRKLEHLLTVHYKTLSAMTKEHLEQGDKPPAGVEVYIKTSIGVRSGE